MMTRIMAQEKDRKVLAARMHDAIIRELIPEDDDRAVEDVFEGMDKRMVLGAIAGLAELLIANVASARDDYGWDWAWMVNEVHREMLKGVFENC